MIGASARRVPAQQRSRERLERILAAATDIIAAKGSDQLKMSELAESAGISIGSLYQYFPEKSAVIRTLAERYHAASLRCIEDALNGVRDLDGLQAAYLSLVDQYYEICLTEPVMRDIWSGMQADKELAAIELAACRSSAALLADVLARVHPKADRTSLAATALLIWHLGEATMRLAISLDRREGDALVRAFKQMTVRELIMPSDKTNQPSPSSR